MNNRQALEFLRGYFHKLFVEKNVDALDEYLHPDYFDEDIGAGVADHIRDSKEYLRDRFAQTPGIGVDVLDAMAQGEVITAFLDWFVQNGGAKEVILRGVIVFVMRGNKIYRRHTFMYHEFLQKIPVR